MSGVWRTLLGGGRLLFRGTLWAVRLFPFQGDTLTWAGLRGGKALRVTKPVFPPRAPPFRARRCCTFRMCEYSEGAMYATMLKSENLSQFLRVRVSRQSNHSLSRTEGGLHSRPVPGTECKKRNFSPIYSINRKQACYAGRFSVPIREKWIESTIIRFKKIGLTCHFQNRSIQD